MKKNENDADTPRAGAATAGELEALLGAGCARPLWRRATFWIGIVLLVAAGAGLYAWQARKKADAAPSFVTEAVTRGSIVLTVTANGTLQPTRSVNIGSELSGTVARVLVDVNDQVKKGQVLVELDTAKLRDQILRSRATLAAAEAAVAQAVATVKEVEASLARLDDVARLSGGKVPSRAELDAARAALERARAEETSARANVANAKAALSTDETNLAKASIRSSIDGVVLTRSVEPGQAVAASLQAVTLFTIAEDLKRLRLEVNVDEADIGSLVAGQQAQFTVSAWPNRRYPAMITRVAYGSKTTDNVVTYTTYLDVDNADLSLRPGMTATATIAAVERREVLRVPTTALRFTPLAVAAAAAAAPAASGTNSGIVGRLVPQPPRGTSTRRSAGAGANGAESKSQRRVWVLRDGQPVAVPVVAGIGDGRLTEVESDQLQAGLAVIVDQHAKAAK